MIDNQAIGTLTTLARSITGILTLLIHTSLILGTGQIIAAANLTNAIFTDLSLGAGRVRVANSAARATHTFLISQAVLVITATALTATAIAKLIRLTVSIGLTNGDGRFTRHFGIADQTIGTRADLLVIVDITLGIGATGTGIGAGINTLLIDARQIVGTALI